MTKITYEFDSEKDQDHMAMMGQAPGMYRALLDMDGWLRNQVKYGDDEDEARITLLWEVRNKFIEIMADENVDLDCVS